MRYEPHKCEKNHITRTMPVIRKEKHVNLQRSLAALRGPYIMCVHETAH